MHAILILSGKYLYVEYFIARFLENNPFMILEGNSVNVIYQTKPILISLLEL